MVDEFEFFRKVRAYYNNVPFLVQFTYRLSHRVDKAVTARGSFSCRVNPHTQIVEYVLELKSDIISRPYSEHSSLLFSSIYEEITAQTIELTEFPIQSLKYQFRLNMTGRTLLSQVRRMRLTPTPYNSCLRNGE